ncbi:GlmU family protein [Rosettibacter firmus]|uniref:GlmU family protein n=1 Tax=Rosettibacter firmus TaxID=3111522 RepID=UPI00336C1FBE
MLQAICLFEDSDYKNLLPLVYFRPVFDLRCGIMKLIDKVKLHYPDYSFILHCREYLNDSVKMKYSNFIVNEIPETVNRCLFVNSRVIVNDYFKNQVVVNGEDVAYIHNDTVVAAIVSGKNLDMIKKIMKNVFTNEAFANIKKQEINVTILKYPWDFVNINGSQIVEDFGLIVNKNDSMIRGKIYDGAYLLNKDNIFIDEGVKIKPGVVLDAEEGPIYIGKNVQILPNAVIEGPCFIGDNSVIKIGAKIYENTSIGEVCKIGGEVEASIIHSYTNKQHDGFLGHSYLGQWINLGADTNNSDLKNNYGTVKVIINDEQVDSDSIFVGLIMGDHSKCSINTMFNTGTVVGVSCNIFGAGFPPKYIPSFSWGGSESLTTYEIDKSIDVARKVMKRRNIEFTAVDEKLFREVFKLTENERKKRGM